VHHVVHVQVVPGRATGEPAPGTVALRTDASHDKRLTASSDSMIPCRLSQPCPASSVRMTISVGAGPCASG
jgi:hypothetical protein